MISSCPTLTAQCGRWKSPAIKQWPACLGATCAHKAYSGTWPAAFVRGSATQRIRNFATATGLLIVAPWICIVPPLRKSGRRYLLTAASITRGGLWHRLQCMFFRSFIDNATLALLFGMCWTDWPRVRSVAAPSDSRGKYG